MPIEEVLFECKLSGWRVPKVMLLLLGQDVFELVLGGDAETMCAGAGFHETRFDRLISAGFVDSFKTFDGDTDGDLYEADGRLVRSPGQAVLAAALPGVLFPDLQGLVRCKRSGDLHGVSLTLPEGEESGLGLHRPGQSVKALLSRAAQDAAQLIGEPPLNRHAHEHASADTRIPHCSLGQSSDPDRPRGASRAVASASGWPPVSSDSR